MEIERIYAMPNHETFNIKPVRELLNQELTPGIWLDPFARNSQLSTLTTKVITNDLNTECNTDYHLEATEFLKRFDDNSIDGVLFDPPYSPRQIKECYQGIGLEQYNTKSTFYSETKNEIQRIVKPNGKVISFGWNSIGMSKSRGFMIIKVLLVPHGGMQNDTICTVEIKR